MIKIGKVNSIFIYPVKSFAAMEMSEADITSTGLKNDRRWMVVDAKGVFVTQRDIAEFCLIKPSIEDDHLTLTYANDRITVKPSESHRNVRIFKSEMLASSTDKMTSSWLSDHFKRELHLVEISNKSNREKYIPLINKKTELHFVDGYPIHFIFKSSMERFNILNEHQYSIMRFRPNIIVSPNGR